LGFTWFNVLWKILRDIFIFGPVILEFFGELRSVDFLLSGFQEFKPMVTWPAPDCDKFLEGVKDLWNNWS
jgi:hypothetical protein